MSVAVEIYRPAELDTFKPDYARWWNHPEATQEDIACLILGISPDHWRRYNTLKCRTGLRRKDRMPTDDDSVFMSHFQEYVERHCINIINGAESTLSADDVFRNCLWEIAYANSSPSKGLLEPKLWKGGKRAYVERLYARGIPNMGECPYDIHPDFYAFLSRKGEPLEHFDRYRNHHIYECDYTLWRNRQPIDSEITAFALVLGYAPEYLEKFFQCEAHLEARVYNFTLEEHFFHRHYVRFLNEHHSYDLYPLYKHTADKRYWNGNFIEYVQALYDDGFLFTRPVYNFLSAIGWKQVYSFTSWVPKVYREWTEKPLWSLWESCDLFAGFDGHRPPHPHALTDLRQKGSFALYMRDPGINSDIQMLLKNGKRENISDFVQEHLDAAHNTLVSRQHDPKEGHRFVPREIITFLMQHCRHTPPPILLESLGITDSPDGTRDDFPEKNLKPSRKHSERCRALAQYFWESNPELTINDMVKKDEIKRIGCEGGSYATDTIRKWINDLCPNRQPGRRPRAK